MKYLAFDLEVCSWPEDGEWDHKTPLGVSCVGMMGSDWDKPEVWYASSCIGKPEPRAMVKEELADVKSNLAVMDVDDYRIVGWNSLQFDFLILALDDPDNFEFYADLAMNHVDPMFYIVCSKGWPVGLQTVARGLRLPGKTEGMSGDKAPDMWMNGSLDDRNKILEYVGQDATTTLDIVEVASRTGYLRWYSKSGNPQKLPILNREIPTVKECLNIIEPDTSWMDNPMKREDFYAWTKSNLQQD